MSDFLPADLIKDNDPRMGDRVLMVIKADGDRIEVVNTSGRRFKISRKRIFFDSKPRRYGFNVLMDRRIK
jgi:hypothetical protein